MSQSILVTGGHGFLGRNVARYFSRAGHVVTGIGHGAWSAAELASFGFSFWHTADITLDALESYAEKPDIIVHCAGSGSVAFSMSHPYQDFARTVTATAAVLEYIRLHSPGTTLVYPSSAAVYGVVERLPIQESDALRPASPYGVHKLMVEQMCQSYAAHYQIDVAIVRLFSIYGEGLKKQLLWDACSKIARGETGFFGTGAELRDWLHVEDAATLLEAAARNASAACPVTNGGSGEGVAVKEILSEVFEAYGALQQPRFSGQQRPGDPQGYQADMSVATAWGWRSLIPWREGVRRYVDWFKGGGV